VAENSSSRIADGFELKGRYRIEKLLNQGGFGTIYLARDLQLNSRAVVVKVLLERVANDEWFRRKFSEEIAALARINDPGVVQVYDSGVLDEGQPYMVMQFVEGETLRKTIRPGGMDLARAARLLRSAGRALSAAHEKGVVHRDLKPDNLMVRADDQITLIDFGIASVADAETGHQNERTKVAGTFTYMAPEQFDGKPTAASDVYGLGVIAFEMLAGAPPSAGKPMFELMLMQKEGTWPKISELRPSVPAAAQELILKALSADPEKRFVSPREFGDALADALVGASARPADPAPPPITPKPVSRRAWIWAAVGTGTAAAGGFAAKRWWFPATAPTPPPPVRELAYSIEVQRYRDGKPYKEPFTLAREVVFESDDRIRLRVMPAESGYLYVVNEAPDGSLGMLFPNSKSNGGSARLTARQTISIPEASEMRFDSSTGVEKLWLYWSPAGSIALAEIPYGPIVEPEPVRALLKPSGEAKTEGGRTVIRGPGTLVHRIELMHR